MVLYAAVLPILLSNYRCHKLANTTSTHHCYRGQWTSTGTWWDHLHNSGVCSCPLNRSIDSREHLPLLLPATVSQSTATNQEQHLPHDAGSYTQLGCHHSLPQVIQVFWQWTCCGSLTLSTTLNHQIWVYIHNQGKESTIIISWYNIMIFIRACYIYNTIWIWATSGKNVCHYDAPQRVWLCSKWSY